MRMLRFQVLLCIAALLAAACSGALRERYDDAPHGGFAPEQLDLMRSAPALSVGDHGEPDVVITPPDGDAPPAATIDLRGPILAEELTAIGLDVTQEALDAARVLDWRPPETLTRRVARDVFLARSPTVAAAVKRHRVSHARYDQIDYLNDLVRQYDAFAEGLKTQASTPHVMPARVSWPLEGAGRIQSELAEVDVAISQARMVRGVLRALVTFEQAFQEALYWSHARRVLSENVRLAEQSLRAAQARYRASSGHYSHVIVAQSRLELLRVERRSATERVEVERRKLAATLDLDLAQLDDIRLELGGDLPPLPDRETLTSTILAQSPDILEAEVRALRSLLMIQLVERQLLPEISPGLSHTRTGDAPKRAASDLMYATRAPFLAELKLVHDATLATLEQTRRLVPAQADARWAALSSASRSYRLMSGAQRKRARQTREASNDGYRAGSVSFFELDDALSRYLEVGLNAHARRRDAFLAAAELQVISGLAPLAGVDALRHMSPDPVPEKNSTTDAPEETP